MKISKIAMVAAMLMTQVQANDNQDQNVDVIRVATFNVSMEALNYVEHRKDKPLTITGKELSAALNNNHQQIKNIAEIIQRVKPDILLLNEFDYSDSDALNLFINQYLAKPQSGQQPIKYPYSYQAPVNTGILLSNDATGDSNISHPSDTHGFGYFPGHFGMALLSKYKIDHQHIRTFQHFLWKDMPGALKPIDPATKAPWFPENVWQQLRLSSKSHWDIPITINNQNYHVLASHPTPPVFDGEEDRNGKRNHDEIRFWRDYISDGENQYIYDDKKHYGGLTPNKPFVILGDQNASAVEGDAINTGIARLLSHEKINDPLPASTGGKLNKPDNFHAEHHTAHWGMRADYVLPSSDGWKIVRSGVFWPEISSKEYRLIKDRKASSDHRLVWVDLKLQK